MNPEDEPRLSRYIYQGLPARGYTEFMRELLGGIPVLLNTDYLEQRDAFRARKYLIFTGSIDEFSDLIWDICAIGRSSVVTLSCIILTLPCLPSRSTIPTPQTARTFAQSN